MTDLARKLAGMSGLYDTIARSHPSLLRGRVWCAKCNSFKDVDAARCLREGWPKCHGQTMSIDAPKENGCGNG
jgi:Zn finger protein HypA/HybF involved in hydrogenase expression